MSQFWTDAANGFVLSFVLLMGAGLVAFVAFTARYAALRAKFNDADRFDKTLFHLGHSIAIIVFGLFVAAVTSRATNSNDVYYASTAFFVVTIPAFVCLVDGYYARRKLNR